ncbi:hypothetical protein [Pedobacter antarcticus]|uniref:hypothetical protein n=1 Tax=Pedobacter antarcticus TaxID=34086 RepID=UPI00292D0BF9|nr:hypothetical protein [Pedobacter antarcticus]
MEIGDQYAKGDIYNIDKMDLNGGTIKADAVFLNTSVGDVELLTKDSQSALNAQFKISYLDFIIADTQKKFLIKRSLLTDLSSRLEVQNELPLIGVPGVGKTCILFLLSKELTNVVYIPIKGKSVITVVAHLINKINLAAGLPLINLTDADAGLEILQGLLATSKMTFMLDDCESNPEVVKKLVVLKKLDNNFIYASRNDHEFIANGIEPFAVGSFSFEEVKDFISGSGVRLDVMTTNELFEASQGNPLYLYYFTQFQIVPLPKNITDYHQAIWGSITPKQQQCLIYIALSYKPLKIQSITDLIPFEYPTEADDFIGSLVALVKNENGLFEIFHPAFKEYIVEKLKSSQLISHYREELGNYYLKKKDDLQATHLLIDYNPKALEKIANDVVHQLISEGDLTFATRVMLVMLEFKRTIFAKGYLHYHLAFNFKMLNENEKAEYHQEKSLEYFNNLKQRTWYNVALMNKAISLVEDGRTEEGLAIADKVLEKSKGFGSEFEGQLLVNVSKIYVDIHENEKAAKASLRAYQSFEKQNHVFGMLSSLTNMASALAKLNDYTDIAAQYAGKLLEYAKTGIAFNLELIALNILTSINRQNGNYAEAKKFGQKAVMLCQHYKLENKAILNLVNYGNVLRDAGEIDDSLAVYQEALIATTRLGLIKDESRIYWILAEIYSGKEEYAKAIEYIDASIARAKEINYNYGVAHGYEDKAGIYQKMNDLRSAAKNFSLSATSFETLSDFSKEKARTLQKAILLYLELGEKDEANNLFKNAAKNLQRTGFSEFNSLINNYGNDLDIHSYFKSLTQSYLKQEAPTNLTFEYTMYLEYCLANPKSCRQQFNSLMQDFATFAIENRFALTILALLIEQSKALIDGSDLNKLLNILTAKVLGFHARAIAHETVLLLKLSNGLKLEIICYTEDTISLKLATALALFLVASPDLLIVDKMRKQDFCKVQILMLKDFRNLFSKIKIPAIDERFLSYHLQKRDYDIPNYIVIDERYEKSADLVVDINNKHFMYFLGAAIRTLITNYYHLGDNITDRLTKPVTRKLAFFMGLTGLEEIKAQKEAYFVDLSKLDELVNKYFNNDGRLG